MPLTDTEPPSAGQPAWAAPPRRRRPSRAGRRRVSIVLAVLAVGGPAFLVGGRFWIGHVSVAEGVARYRAAAAAGTAPADSVPGLPAPGVYSYRTTGGERISFLGYHRPYSSTTVRIVTRQGCGVREQQWFLVQHEEYYDRCPGGELASYGTDIAYWWTHGTQDFTCAPGGSFDMAGRAPGDQVTWQCHDEDTRAAQVTRYVGDEDVTVDGQDIRARHTQWVTTFSGATVGAATVDDWFQPQTGLVLREKRAIGLRVGSPFVGKVSYVDQSEFTLESLTPSR